MELKHMSNAELQDLYYSTLKDITFPYGYQIEEEMVRRGLIGEA